MVNLTSRNLIWGRLVRMLALLVSLLVTLLGACADDRASPAKADKASYALVCYGAARDSSYASAGYGSFDAGWTWAYDDQGYAIYVEGSFEDGFFVVQHAYSWSSYGGRINAFQGSAPVLKSICESSLSRSYGSRDLQLLRMSASTYQGYLWEHSLAFQNPLLESPFSRLVVFGDSYSDQGNLKRWVQGIPLTPYFLGRFADGPIWLDYLANDSELAIQNWSFGGAQSGPHNDVSLLEFTNYIKSGGRNVVTGSVSSYVEGFIASLPGRRLVSPEQTLFVIWSGGNDYGSKMDNAWDIDHLLDDGPNSSRGNFVVAERATDGTANEVRKLYAAGARHFLIFTLPNYGVAPIVSENILYHQWDSSQTLEEKRYALSTQITAGIDRYNRLLLAKLSLLQAEFSDLKLEIFDLEATLTKLTNDIAPSGSGSFRYGFDLANQIVELKSEGKPPIRAFNRCFSRWFLGSSDPRADTCPEVNRTFYYDDVHFTSYVHCWLSYFIQRTLSKNHSMALEALLFEEYFSMCNGLEDELFGRASQ